MHEYRINEQVRVIAPHRYDGDLYTQECQVGDILVVKRVTASGRLSCKREEDQQPGFTGVSSLTIDPECVQPVDPVDYDAEAAALFGVTPPQKLFGVTPPQKHCPTCTCAEEAS